MLHLLFLLGKVSFATSITSKPSVSTAAVSMFHYYNRLLADCYPDLDFYCFGTRPHGSTGNRRPHVTRALIRVEHEECGRFSDISRNSTILCCIIVDAEMVNTPLLKNICSHGYILKWSL